MKARLVRLAPVLVVALAFAGCTTTEPQTEPGGEDPQGGDTQDVLRIGVADALAIATEPAYVGNPATQHLTAEIYNQLVTYRDGEASPELAESWTSEGNTWTFTLREATFSDGSPVTGDDVKASLERLVDPDLGAATRSLWADVLESIEAPDEKSVVITTKQPLGTLLANISVLNISPAAELRPIQKELQLELGTATLPIGSGPYVLESHTSEQEAVLVVNENYWGEPPSIERLEYVYIPELTARYTALETGDIDFTWGVPPDQLPRLKSVDELTVEVLPSHSVYVMYMNGSREPFDDENVRRAMRLAVDMDQIAEDLFPDFGEVATAPVPRGVFGYSEQEPYAYDPELASSLLADAGLPDGFASRLQYVSNSAPQIDQLIQAMISYWAAIGVQVEPVPMEAAAWGSDLREVNFDMSMNSSGTPTGDADYTLTRLYSVNAPAAEIPYSGVRDADLDAAIAAAQSSLDPAERKEQYETALQLMWDKTIAFWPIQPPMVYAWRTDAVADVYLAPVPAPLFEGAKKLN